MSTPEYTIIPGLPVQIDINAYSGDTWNQKFRLKQGNPPMAIDLTPYTINSQIRNRSNAEVYDLQCDILDQSDPNSDTYGVFVLSIPSDLDPYPPPANYAYDVQLTDNSGVPAIITTWIAGRFFLEQDVTRTGP